jgi:hypothetical protein
LDGVGQGIHRVLGEILLDEALVEPVVTNELALAVADFDTWETVGLAAVEFFDVVLVVVADVFAKGRLLVELGLLPLGAVCIANIVGTLVPSLEDGHGVLVVLDNHETGVGVGAVETVRVVLGLSGIPGVLCHDKRVLRLDVPVVQHPLDGEMDEAEGSVGIEEDNEFVVFDVVGQGRGLDPGGVAVLELGGMDELVVVAVGHGVGVVAEDAARDVLEVAPVELALFKDGSRGERAGFEVEDEDVAAHVLGVAGVGGQGDFCAVGLADEGLGGRDLDGVVQHADDIAEGGGFGVADGPVRNRRQPLWGRGRGRQQRNQWLTFRHAWSRSLSLGERCAAGPSRAWGPGRTSSRR